MITEQERTELIRVIGFLSSCIICGEPYTDQVRERRDTALKILKAK